MHLCYFHPPHDTTLLYLSTNSPPCQQHLKEEQNLASIRVAFASFALGDTNYLGKVMAYHETSLVIAKTLWYFDFGKASGEAGKLGEGQSGNMNGRGRIDKYQLFDLAVVDHDGPNLVFALREEYWRELSDEGFKA